MEVDASSVNEIAPLDSASSDLADFTDADCGSDDLPLDGLRAVVVLLPAPPESLALDFEEDAFAVADFEVVFWAVVAAGLALEPLTASELFTDFEPAALPAAFDAAAFTDEPADLADLADLLAAVFTAAALEVAALEDEDLTGGVSTGDVERPLDFSAFPSPAPVDLGSFVPTAFDFGIRDTPLSIASEPQP